MEDAFPARPRPPRRRSRPTPAASLRVPLALALALATGPGCSSRLGGLASGYLRSNYVGTTAASFLRHVRDDPDPNVRYLAYAKLASPNCYDNPGQRAEAVRTLIEKLEAGKEPVATRAVIVRTLGELRDPSARDAVIKRVSDPEPVLRVQACRALGKVGRAEDATVLARVMTVDTLEDCRIAAIEAVGELKPNDPRITRMLVTGMEHDDPATRLASLEALKKLTGRDLGTDVVAWQKVLGPEPKGEKAKAPETLIASPAVAPPPAVAAAPILSPRPAPIAAPDPEAQTASYPPGMEAVPRAGAGSYPGRNPNLPPR